MASRDDTRKTKAELIGELQKLRRKLTRLENSLPSRDEELIRQINNNLTNGMIYQMIVDDHGGREFTYLGDNVRRFHGITPEEGMRDPSLIYNHLHPDDRESLLAAEQKAIVKMETFRCEARMKTVEGGYRWSYFVSSPRRMEDGSIRWDGIEFDVSELKRAEEGFRSLIENVDDVFIRYGLDLRFQYVDPKIEKILPIRAAGWIGKTHQEAGLPAELLGLFDGTLEKVRATGRPEAVEFELDAIAGRGFFESIAYPEFGPGGKVKSLVTVTRDVTGRKMVENELARRDAHIRSINNHLANGMIYQIVRDREGRRRFAYLGDNVRSFYGVSPEEGMADPNLIYGRVFDQDRERVLREEEEAFRTMSTFRSEVRIRTPQGGTRWSLFVSSPRVLEDGATCWDGIEFDITDRKRAEEALRESEERYRAFAEASFDGMFIHEGGVVLDANPRFAELFGLKSVDEVIGRDPIDDLNLTEKSRAFARGEIRARSGKIFEISLSRPNGSIRLLEARAREIAYKGRPARAVTIRDISDRKRMEEERLKAQRLESIGLLAGGIAHDFNNILTGIMGNISIALLELERGKNPRDNLEAAEKASLRARDLTNQLLTFSKGGAPVLRPASVRDIVEEAAGFVSRGSNVRCDLTFAAGLLPANIDAGQIGQVVHNLVLNAIQSMPGGGIVRVGADKAVMVENNSLLLPAGNYILITVADRGPGIPAENLPRLFDPYFTTKPKGTGLGLATCYSIVTRHGGKITAESPPGGGAVFRVYLPAAKTAAETAERPTPAPAKGRGRVLVMDDDDAVREVAVLMLEELGYEVEAVAEGRQAVEKYRAARDSGRPFAAVIFDLTVPGGMGGKDAIAEIKKLDPAAKAIVASGYSNDPVLADFSDYGFSAKVAKPYNFAELGEAVARVLGKTA